MIGKEFRKMKRIFIIVSAAIILFGCSKIEEVDQPFQDDVQTDLEVSANIPKVIYASVDDEKGENETRTYVDGNKVLWHKGDEIAYHVGEYSNLKYIYNGEDGASSAKLDLVEGSGNTTETSDIDNLYAVYPYSASIGCEKLNSGDEHIYVNYPSEQTYTPNSFGRGANLMVAASEDINSVDHIYFRNACGYFVIKLTGEGEKVKSIKLIANDGVKIAGKAYVVASHNAAPEVTMMTTDDATSEVTLNCAEGVTLGDDVTEFWFALPPVTFTNGLTIEITDDHGNVVTKSTSKEVVITRNEIQPMKALTVPEKLYYTRSDNSVTPLTFYENMPNPFDAEIKAHYYDTKEGRFVIAFNTPVTKINDYAFRKTNIATISIPSTVTTIGQEAFYNSTLTEITIPGTVNVISREAFDSCLDLKTLTFLPSPTNSPLYLSSHGATKYTPFYNCAYVESINLDRNIFEGDVVGVDGVTHSTCTFTYGRVTNVILGQQVERICDEMFWEAKITSIVIPSSVKSIGNKAFYKCGNLESVTIAGTITSIDASVFEDCSKLSTLNITGSVNTIANGTFDDSKITTIDISGHVGTIDAYAFDDYDNLLTLKITGTLDTIGERAFNDCDALATVNVTGTVNKVGKYAFSDCDAVTSLAIPANIVDDYAYEDMDGLVTAKLYGATVGKGVFYDCDALVNVTIDGSVNTMGNDAFYSCPSIKNVTLLPSQTNTDLTLGYQTYMGGQEGPFKDSKLEKVDWNRNISYKLYTEGGLNEYDEGIFSQNPNLTDVTIGNQVKWIPDYTFAETGIVSITVPSSVETLGNYSFAGCKKLESITYKGKQPTMGTGVFKDCGQIWSTVVPE